jgi:hypothetical protein
MEDVLGVIRSGGAVVETAAGHGVTNGKMGQRRWEAMNLYV